MKSSLKLGVTVICLLLVFGTAQSGAAELPDSTLQSTEWKEGHNKALRNYSGFGTGFVTGATMPIALGLAAHSAGENSQLLVGLSTGVL